MTAGEFVTEASLDQQIEALSNGSLTAADAVQAYLDRIDAYDQQGPCLNSLVRVNPNALEEARTADLRRRQGQPLGPLHGVAVMVKDNYLTRDMPTSAGSVALASFQPDEDAAQVRALKQAGAIILGKTTLHEFSSGVTTWASMSGLSRNALNRLHTPGGSSGGSAAAVAASFAAAALGTDTSGSIRIPAAFQALYGLRPTVGRFSKDGVVPLCPSFDTVGPIARTPGDLARLLDAMALGPDQAAVSYHQHLQAMAHGSMATLRIGVLNELNADADPQVGRVIEEALRTLRAMRAMRATILPASLPGLDEQLPQANLTDLECADALRTFLVRHAAPMQSLPQLMEQGGYHHLQHALFQRRAFPENGRPILEARAAAAKVREQLAALMRSERLDALLYPSCRMLPAPLGRQQTGGNGMLSAVSGYPAITLPAGIGQDGSAIGLELLAAPHRESLLLKIAQQWHQTVQPAFQGAAFLPPLPITDAGREYRVRAGGSEYAVHCLLQRAQARLTFEARCQGGPTQALALNLEMLEHGQWLALDTLHTDYRSAPRPHHHGLTLHTWRALNESRLRLRAFARGAEWGGEGVVLDIGG